MGNTRSRILSTVAVGAALALTLSGCGGSDGGGSSASGSATSSKADGAPARGDADLVIWADGQQVKGMKKIGEKFAKDNGITVDVQAVAKDLQTTFVTANNAGNGPDIVVGAHDWIGNLVQNSAIDPINIPAKTTDLYNKSAIDAVTYSGQLYGVPNVIETLGLYRNTDLVKKAPKTMDDVVSMGKKSGAQNALCLPVGTDGDAFNMQPIYTSAGGYLFGDDAKGTSDPSDLGVGKPGSIKAAKKIAELGKEKVLKKSITNDNVISLFTDKKCAFLQSGPWALADVKKSGVKFDLEAVPGFKGGDKAQAFNSVQAAFVARGGKNKAFAQQFATNLAGNKELAKMLFDTDPRPPALTSVYDEIKKDNPDVAKFYDFTAQGKAMPAIPAMANVWDPLGKAYSAIIGGANPTSTMKSAGATIEKSIK